MTFSTSTLNVQVAVFPAASVATAVTVVLPGGNAEPDGGVVATVTPGQLSEAIGTGKLTTTELAPGDAKTVTFAGHVIAGGWVSTTVTVKLHVGPADELHVTVVVPTGKNEPEAGVQVTVAQSPVTVGGGKFTTAPH